MWSGVSTHKSDSSLSRTSTRHQQEERREETDRERKKENDMWSSSVPKGYSRPLLGHMDRLRISGSKSCQRPRCEASPCAAPRVSTRVNSSTGDDTARGHLKCDMATKRNGGRSRKRCEHARPLPPRETGHATRVSTQKGPSTRGQVLIYFSPLNATAGDHRHLSDDVTPMGGTM